MTLRLEKWFFMTQILRRFYGIVLKYDSDNFVIKGIKIDFYDAHSTMVIRNRLRMCLRGNVVIMGNEKTDDFFS